MGERERLPLDGIRLRTELGLSPPLSGSRSARVLSYCSVQLPRACVVLLGPKANDGTRIPEAVWPEDLSRGYCCCCMQGISQVTCTT